MAIDYEALFGREIEYDPCAALLTLRPVYMQLLAGEGAQVIVFRDRRVECQKADIPALKSLISQLESECRASRGLTARRSAITAGFRE